MHGGEFGIGGYGKLFRRCHRLAPAAEIYADAFAVAVIDGDEDVRRLCCIDGGRTESGSLRSRD